MEDKKQVSGSQSVSSGDLPVLMESSASIRSTMEVIDASALSVALLIDSEGRLTGVVTDGDIRRALLQGEELDAPLTAVVNRSPLVSRAHESRAAVLDMMLSRVIDQIPIIDDNGYLVGLHTLREILGREPKETPVLILAGGLGTRLGDITQDVPKSMLTVAGRPILERLIDHLIGFGIYDLTLSVSYKADKIMDYFGDGAQLGCKINYMQDKGGNPRGSGGPLIDFVAQRHMTKGSVVVINGDLVTDVDIDRLLREHQESGALITIATSTFLQRIPYGVVRSDANGHVEAIEEKPLIESNVNAGIYVVDCSAAKLSSSTGQIPMTSIINQCLFEGGRVHAMQLDGDWRDIGQPLDLARARGFMHYLS